MPGDDATSPRSMTAFANTLLAPGKAVIARLTVKARLVILVVVLMIPTCVLGQAYLSKSNSQIAFADKERDGASVLRPALLALAGTLSDRPVDLAALARSVRDHPDLDLASVMAKVNAAANTTSAAGRADLAGKLTELIVVVGNQSNLLLDPDLDSFYVMDSLLVQLPSVLSAAASAAVPPSGTPTDEDIAARAVLAGKIASATSALRSDWKSAVTHTSQADLESRLEQLRPIATAAQGLRGALAADLSGRKTVDVSALGAATVANAGAGTTALDRLLQARIDGFESQFYLILAITLVSLLAALWFTVATVVVTRRDARRTVDAVRALAVGDVRARSMPDGRDEFGDIGRALSTATDTLRATIGEIGEHAEQLTTASRQMSAASTSISTAADETTTQAESVAGAAEIVREHVTGVAAASTQFGASINDIAKSASEAARVASSASDLAMSTTSTVSQLARSTAEITDVIKLIRSVADQTNLLALNATIEASRAGEAGRGFAVVASEVKNLAEQTASATADITQRIKRIQDDSQSVSETIAGVVEVISQISQFQISIAGAVEEQNVTAAQISQQVTEAATGSADISRSIGSVEVIARKTTEHAQQSQATANGLAGMSTELQDLVGRFQR